MSDDEKKEDKKKEDPGMKVCLRFRPQNKIELAHKAVVVVKFSDDGKMVEINHPDKTKQPKPLKFYYDRVFGMTTPQPEVYLYTASNLVDQLFEGFNATIFAYGQTGAGKTYSMEGKLGSPHRGIVPRVVERIFEKIEESPPDFEFLLKISYVEIYLERLRDLFEPDARPLRIRESKFGVFIEGVCELYVSDAEETIEMMEIAAANRTVNATGMNAVSSRSHGVFMLKLEQKHVETGTKKLSKLMMVDLAGSEKVSKTGASGSLLEEAKKINQSLSALGNVMNALSSGKTHVSYRDSVLTRLLSDSLGGNCKTTLLIACSPSSFNVDETITTCRFGARAKKIVNKAKINVDKTVAEYKKEVAGLTKKVEELKATVKSQKKQIRKLKKIVTKAKEAGFVAEDGADDSEDERKAAEAKAAAEAAAAEVERSSFGAEELDAKERELDQAKEKILQLKAMVSSCTCHDEDARIRVMATVTETEDEVVGGEFLDIALTSQISAYLEDHSTDALGKSSSLTSSDSAMSITAASTATSIKSDIRSTPLDPAKVDELLKPLKQERTVLIRNIENLSREAQELRRQMDIKDGRLQKIRRKFDDLESQCDKLMVEKEYNAESMELMKEECEIMKKQLAEAGEKVKAADAKVIDLKARCDRIEREAEDRIHRMHKEQELLAKDLMEKARAEIAKWKRKAGHVDGSSARSSAASRARGGAHRGRKTGVTKMRDEYVASMKEARRTEEDYEASMRELEDRALDCIFELKMEQQQLRESLEDQTRLYLRTKMELSEAIDRLCDFDEVLAERDGKIAAQNEELEHFGMMKRSIEQAFHEERQELSESIMALKAQIRDLKSMGGKDSEKDYETKPKRARVVRSDARAMSHRRRIAKPIRGGGARGARRISRIH